MSTQEYIRSITEIVPDDFPTLTPLPDTNNSSFFSNITWETWLIAMLILLLLGINIFAYLAKGTEEGVSMLVKIFNPILSFFGYSALTTAKQTIETTASGSKAGIDIATDVTVGAIDNIQENGAIPIGTSGTSTGISRDESHNPSGEMAASSFQVQQRIQEGGSNVDKWQQDSLVKALDNSKQSIDQISPDDSRSSIQTIGKSGWCYIGEEQGIRTCSEIGANDICMSGDVFPNHAICMNPNLRS